MHAKCNHVTLIINQLEMCLHSGSTIHFRLSQSPRLTSTPVNLPDPSSNSKTSEGVVLKLGPQGPLGLWQASSKRCADDHTRCCFSLMRICFPYLPSCLLVFLPHLHLDLSSGQSFPPESHWFDTTGIGAHHAGVTPTMSRRRESGEDQVGWGRELGSGEGSMMRRVEKI